MPPSQFCLTYSNVIEKLNITYTRPEVMQTFMTVRKGDKWLILKRLNTQAYNLPSRTIYRIIKHINFRVYFLRIIQILRIYNIHNT